MSWLTGWNYRKSHTINSATGAGTNYQVKITAHYGNGIDSNTDTYCNCNCRTDFGDIRFSGSDGSTQLNYWMESKTENDKAVFWVKIADDLSSTNTTIYVYYGNLAVQTTSNGEGTFLFFDDCNGSSIDTNKWTTVNGTWTEQDGFINAPTNSVDENIYNDQLSDNIAVETNVRKNYAGSFAGIVFISDSNDHVRLVTSSQTAYSDKIMIGKRVAGTWTDSIATGTTVISTGTWYHLKATKIGNAYTMTLFSTDYSQIDSLSATITDFGNLNQGLSKYWAASFDNFRVRKYVSPEPSPGNWGTEETAKLQVVHSNLEVTGSLIANDAIQGNEYKASDGTGGATADVTISGTTLHFKNGLFVG